MNDPVDAAHEAALAERIRTQAAWDQPTEDLAFMFRRLREVKAGHEHRVSELLAANNAEVERRRAVEAAFSWQPIDTLPGSADAPVDISGEREPLILAKTADGQRMIWRPSILRSAMKEGTPAHLGFQAIAWMPLPE